MVSVEHDRRGGRCFILRPDLAPNWRQTMVAFALIAMAPLGLALVLTVRGFWPVLVFAGIEIGVLGWALYVSGRRALEREVIWVRAGEVEVQKGRYRPERSWRFHRFWTEVVLVPSRHRWYPSRLLLRSSGQEVASGGFLHEEERVRLARQLARCIGPMAAMGEAT